MKRLKLREGESVRYVTVRQPDRTGSGHSVRLVVSTDGVYPLVGWFRGGEGEWLKLTIELAPSLSSYVQPVDNLPGRPVPYRRRPEPNDFPYGLSSPIHADVVVGDAT